MFSRKQLIMRQSTHVSDGLVDLLELGVLNVLDELDVVGPVGHLV